MPSKNRSLKRRVYGTSDDSGAAGKILAAETTIEEENSWLNIHTAGHPAQWEPLRNVFAYFEEEAKIIPGEDFEARLLERILQVEAAASTPSIESGSNRHPAAGPGPAPVRPLLNRTPVGGGGCHHPGPGLSRLIGPTGGGSPGQGSLAQSRDSTPAKESPATAYNDAATIKDTYEDPQQALAAIRRALGTASAKMNRGKSITQKQMDRMNDGWQSALTN